MASVAALLAAFGEEDNTKRNQAEDVWQSMLSSNAPACIGQLVEQLGTNPDDGSRQMAAVLLRQQLKDRWASLTEQAQDAVKSSLLTRLVGEPVPVMKRKLVHIVAVVASKLAFAAPATKTHALERGEFVLSSRWPQLMDVFGRLVAATDVKTKSLGLFLGNSLLNTVGDPLAKAWAAPLLPVLKTCLTAPPDAHLAIEAARASATVMRVLSSVTTISDGEAVAMASAATTAQVAGRGGVHEGGGRVMVTELSPELRAMQAELLGPLIGVVRSALGHAPSEDDARHTIQDLVLLVQEKPSFVRPYVRDMVGLMLAVIDQETMLEATRVCAVELLTTLTTMGGGMMRKHPKLLSDIVTSFCKRLAMIDEDPAWASKPCHPKVYSQDADDVDDGLLQAAAQGLDRFACVVGGSVAYPLVTGIVGPWFEHADWRIRRAACQIVGIIGEGCKAAMSPSLDSIMRSLAQRFSDPHPRVRFSALTALTQMLGDFQEPLKGYRSIQSTCHSWLVSAILSTCSKAQAATGAMAASCGGAEASLQKVRQVAITTLQAFMHPDACKPSHVQPLDPILRELYDAMTAGNLHTRKEALVALAMLSAVIKDGFAAVYDTFMPVVRKLVADASAAATDPLAIEIRNVAIECAGAMCSVVPKSKCEADANAIMASIKPAFTVEAIRSDEHGAFESYALVIGHIAKALGRDFAPHVSAVLPPLLDVSTQEVESSMEPIDHDELDQYRDDHAHVLTTQFEPSQEKGLSTVVINVPGHGLHRLTVNMHQLKCKSSAAGAIFHLMQSLQELAVPFLKQLTESVLSCSLQQSSEVCRALGISTIPLLVHIANGPTAPAGTGAHVMARCLDTLFDGLTMENSDNVRNTMAEAVTELFKISVASGGRLRLAEGQLTTVLQRLAHLMNESVQRWRDTAMAYHDDDDYDERKAEMLTEALETDSETLGRFVDTVGFIIRSHGPSCLTMIGSTVLPVADKLLEERRDPGLRQVGVCVYDEVLEHGGSGAVSRVAPIIAPHLLEGISSPSVDLRQSCVFGLGVLAKHREGTPASALPSVLSALKSVLTAADADAPHMLCATDNAVASLLRTLQARGGEISSEEQQGCLSAILQRLPLQADAIEARFVHGWFVRTLGSCAPVMVGSGGERAGACLMLLAHLAHTHLQSTAMDEEEALMDGDTAKLVAPAAAAVATKFPASKEAVKGLGQAAELLSPAATPRLVAASAFVDAASSASASAWVDPSQVPGGPASPSGSSVAAAAAVGTPTSSPPPAYGSSPGSHASPAT